MRFLLLTLIVLLTSCATFSTGIAVQEGKRAFQDGDFHTAFRELYPAAVHGNPAAQYAIGYMYYYGYGVPQDMKAGFCWIIKAADQQYPLALRVMQMDVMKYDSGLQF